MRHPLLVEGRPKCARQSLASTLSAPRIAATSYCDPGRHANVITSCLLTPCLHVQFFLDKWGAEIASPKPGGYQGVEEKHKNAEKKIVLISYGSRGPLFGFVLGAPRKTRQL